MQVTYTFTGKTDFQYLKGFSKYLKKNYPVKKKGVKLEVRLLPDENVPFNYNGESIVNRLRNCLEEQARGKKLALWKDNNPQPPWEFRKMLRI